MLEEFARSIVCDWQAAEDVTVTQLSDLVGYCGIMTIEIGKYSGGI